MFVGAWRREAAWLKLLLPFELLYRLLEGLNFSIKGLFSRSLPLPCIVVGSMTIGGAGKTAAVIALHAALTKNGLKVGIISRGYKGSRSKLGFRKSASQVFLSSDPSEVGDEPLLLHWRTGAPVCIGANRHRAAQKLLSHHKLDVILSDDGLQHYSVASQIKLAVFDTNLGISNCHCLPVGPLREPVVRLKRANLLLFNLASQRRVPAKLKKIASLARSNKQEVFAMRTKSVGFVKVADNMLDPNRKQVLSLEQWRKRCKSKKILAVTGIAQPDNFFSLLKELGLKFEQRSYNNHHLFTPDDLADGVDKNRDKLVLMTEKDAVKCFGFGMDNLWAVRLNHELDKKLVQELMMLL